MTTPSVTVHSLTPLDPWIAARIGLDPAMTVTPKSLAAYQLEKLRETLAYVRLSCPFYQDLFSGFPDKPLEDLNSFRMLPFTTARDLSISPLRFLCVSQSRIARAVTLQTSGTTGPPKRLFFTASDLESTVDFFHHGMSGLVAPGQRVLILMPGGTQGSIGDLLTRALARMDVETIVKGPVQDPETTIREITGLGIHSLVGIPVQVLGLVRNPAGRFITPGTLKSVLLSADFVPRTIADEIGRAWAVPVFQHYGMTETGLGGGVECAALDGCHLREADLFF
ncbi:MAG: AMP-binding protein [Pseudomonadota bacterium]